jgi:type VI secretion system protein ImpF
MSTGLNKNVSARPSILDRLIDRKPDETSEPQWGDSQRLEVIRAGIRRDVQDLLNSRFRCVAWPPQLEELSDSLLNYGLPDFTAAGLNLARDPDILIESVRRALNTFEPRLTEVRIRLVGDSFHVDRTLRFRIDAVLLIENQRIPMQLESAVEARTGQFSIGEPSR